MATHRSRVSETASNKPNAGGLFQLSGITPVGYRTFAAAYANGEYPTYFATNGIAWESGIGVFNTGAPNTLTRYRLLESSTGSTIDFSTGASVSIFVEMPAMIGDSLHLSNRAFITGLEITCEGGGYGQYIRVLPGAAYVPGIDRVLTWDNRDSWDNITGYDNWVHIYLRYDSGTSGWIQVTTDPPTDPYFGTARARGNTDYNQRWLGCVYVKSDGTIRTFTHNLATGLVEYSGVNGSPPRVLALGTHSDVYNSYVAYCSAGVPPQSNMAFGRFINTTPPTTTLPTYAMFGKGWCTNYPHYTLYVDCQQSTYLPFPVDNWQGIGWTLLNSPLNGGGAYIDIYGFYLTR